MIRLNFFSIALSLVLLAAPANAQPGTHYSIYLLAGQSNAAGKAPIDVTDPRIRKGLPKKASVDTAGLSTGLLAPQTNVQLFHGAKNTGAGIWENLRPGRSLEGPQYFGPEITMGHDLAAARSDENIRIIKYALGDTTLRKDWNPKRGPQYQAFRKTIANAIAALGPGDTFSIEGFAWLQGESDAWTRGKRSNAKQAAAYGANLTHLIQQIRTDLDEPDLPVVIARISDSPLWDLRAEVRQGQALVNDTVAGTALFSTDDLGLRREKIGLAHYDAPAQETIGSRFAAAFLAMPEPEASR